MLRRGSLISGAEAKHIINALRPCS
jgi:hypothetical protein